MTLKYDTKNYDHKKYSRQDHYYHYYVPTEKDNSSTII